MKKNGMMIFLVVIIALLGLMAVFNKQIRLIFTGGQTEQKMSQSDLEVINDTNDSVSVEYMKDGKKVSFVIKPTEPMLGGEGKMRIHVASKKGFFDLTYPFPRPLDKPSKINLTQIIATIAAKELKVGQNVYTAHGMIDDIKVTYEEVSVTAEGDSL